MATHRSPSKHLHIGVLFCGDVQLLDLAPVDLFAMCSRRYLKACELPSPLLALGFDEMRISYIGEGVAKQANDTSTPQEFRPHPVAAAPNTTLIATTPGLSVRLTQDITSPDVAAGKLDILLIPGPDPAMVASEALSRYLQMQAASTSTDILCVCTGMFPLARIPGFLDGRKLTGPRPLVDMKLRKLAPKALWDDSVRWAVDRGVEVNAKGQSEKTKAELWSSGGITVGNDMVAAYLREKMSPELADLVCTMAEVGDRTREYDESKGAMRAGFVWLLMRSIWRGIWR